MPAKVALTEARITFGGRPLVENAELALDRGDRACLVGRNGAGKSSLLRALSGEIDLDGGSRFVQPGTRIAYLPQEPRAAAGETVHHHVAGGLGAEANETHRVTALLDRLALDPSRLVSELSGGEARRADLARALVADPDILLLDEPTNHLDLQTVEWLEQELSGLSAGILIISHDRAFLNKLTRRTYWLDRGRLQMLERGFAEFEAWMETILEQETVAAYRLDKRIESETRWYNRGITARRKRNEGRRRALEALRQQRKQRLKPQGRAKVAATVSEPSGRLVIEATGIAKSFPSPEGERCILRDFSTRILRGDRVGIIGANGSGKTTLLKILIGEMAPEAGAIRFGTNLQTLFFDQTRESLDPDTTLWRTLAPDGGQRAGEWGAAARRRLFARLSIRRAPGIAAGEKSIRRRAQPFVAGSAVHGGRAISWCWMNRPTISILIRWTCWKKFSPTMKVRCFWSATTATSSTGWSPV
jgi:ATP-binding cassette subfamily F protein uup